MPSDLDYQPTRTFNRPLRTLQAVAVEDATPAAPAEDSPRSRDLALADALDARARASAARGGSRTTRVLHEEAMELRRKHEGEADPRLIRSFTWLGELSLRAGEVEEARWLFEQAHRVACKRFAAGELAIAASLHNLAVALRHSGDYARATALAEEALQIKVERLGWIDGSVAVTLCTLANLARLMGELQVALCYYEKAREVYERTEGGVNPGLATTLIGMARVHLVYGSKVSARFLLERALQIREALVVPASQSAGVRVLLSEVLADEDPLRAHELIQAAYHEYSRCEGARPDVVGRLQRSLERHEAQFELRKAS